MLLHFNISIFARNDIDHLIPFTFYLSSVIGFLIASLFILGARHEIIRNGFKINDRPVKVVFAGVARRLEQGGTHVQVRSVEDELLEGSGTLRSKFRKFTNCAIHSGSCFVPH